MNRVLQFVRDHRAALVPEPDGVLLARFAQSRDESAFAQLVGRHGGVVAGVCRRMLTNPADRDDAFQAVFVVLARKAANLNGNRPLAPWLHRVATLTAKSVRQGNARRGRRLGPLSDALVARPAPDGSADLDEALAALPEKYRVAVVLHYLEGWPRAELAARLGCPEGTLSARISRGLEKLRRRLGDAAPALVASAGAGAVAGPAAHATAAVVAGGGSTAAVLHLSQEVLRMLWLPKLVTMTAGVAGTAAGLAATVAVLSGAPAPGTPQTPAPKADAKPDAPPAKAAEPGVAAQQIQEYERLTKRAAELAAEQRTLALTLARASAQQKEMAGKLANKQTREIVKVFQSPETFCLIVSGQNEAGPPVFPIAVVVAPTEEKPAEKDKRPDTIIFPDGPQRQGQPNTGANGYPPRGPYRLTRVVYADRAELAAALTAAKVKVVLIQDQDFGPEMADELLAACKLAAVADVLCPAPIDHDGHGDRGHFATPAMVRELAVKPPSPLLIRLDVSRLGQGKPAEELPTDPEYARYLQLGGRVAELQAAEARAAAEMKRISVVQNRLVASLARQQDGEEEALYRDWVCVIRPGRQPGQEALPVAVVRRQVLTTGQVFERENVYADRRDLTPILMNNPASKPGSIPRVVVSRWDDIRAFIRFDELTEILAAAKAAKVPEVYLPVPLPGRDTDIKARELLAKYGVKTEAGLFVRIDLAKYEPAARAKP